MLPFQQRFHPAPKPKGPNAARAPAFINAKDVVALRVYPVGMDTWFGAVAALLGALVGGAGAVCGHVVNQYVIRRREDRDKLRAACIDFGESAFRFIQRVEVALIYGHREEHPSAGAPGPADLGGEHYRLVMDAGSAQDQLTTAFCRVTMLRHANGTVDDGEALFRSLMQMPKRIGPDAGTTLDGLDTIAEQKRIQVRDWLRVQSQKLA